MWLLSTDHAELKYFANNFDAIGGYAILSHTWVGKEQTLQEVRAIGERCRASGMNPRDDPELSPKIRNCCLLAEEYGYRWVWIDSCCIDKTSSSELSEAINSMFRWYKEAEVCFAYLSDVPHGQILHTHDSLFRKSRWHTRGWTLQELIAPDFLIFFSKEWRELGNRADLAGLVQEITGVPRQVMTGETQPSNHSVSVRMSWASQRKTTRVEDEAYCLMGLFGVSMPTNYGEGKKAFIRLQYEAMQHNPDMSLFSFGYGIRQNHNLTLHPNERVIHRWQYLMADSPKEFKSTFRYIPDLGKNAKQQYPPPLESGLTGPFEGGVELPRVAVTNYGIELRVPVHEADGITIMVILCESNGQHFGLFLTRDIQGRDPTRPLYFIGCAFSKPDKGSAKFIARMADLGNDLYDLTFEGKPVKALWRTIYVVPIASDSESAKSTTPNLIMNCNPASRFRIPRWLISRFIALQFRVVQLRNTETLQALELLLDQVTRIDVLLGSCTENHRYGPDKHPPLWAKVDVLPSHARLTTFSHDCSRDHINSESWATDSKFFGDQDWGVQLSLMPSTWKSSNSLVVHLELLGRVPKGMSKEAGVPSLFPSLVFFKSEIPRIAPDHNVPAPLSQPLTNLQTEPASPHTPSPPLPRSHSSTSMSTSSQTHFSRIPRPVSQRSTQHPRAGQTARYP